MPQQELAGGTAPQFSPATECNGVVLVHGGVGSEARASRLLSWYDANANVAPHEARCDCAGQGIAPALNCPRCHGSGHYLVMDNPDGKFTSARRLAAWEQWDVSDLAAFVARQCRVIVTPDGEWHDRGSSGQDEWHGEAMDLLADHAHFVVLAYYFGLISESRL